MAITGWSDSNYLRRVALVGTQPMFILGWFNCASSATFRTIWSQGTVSGGSNYHQAQIDDSNLCLVESYDGTGDGIISCGGFTASTWQPMAVSLVSNTSRSVWRGATAREDNTTSVNVTGGSHTIIGRSSPDTAPFTSTGGIAEVSMWNATGQTLANLDSLMAKLYNGGAAGAGGNPLLITAESSQPWSGKLVAYWPLTSTSNMTTDAFGSNTLTTIGSLSNFASHPTIEAAAGANTNIAPLSMIKGSW